jgi:hypothetical protein
MTSRAGASAELGSILRSVLLEPKAGFSAAFTSAGRRAGAGRSPAEGLSPYVGAALGGAGLMLAWLKVGALIGLRGGTGEGHLWAYTAATATAGAVVALVALPLWGLAGSLVTRALGVTTRARDVRIVGGLSGFPQVFGLVVLLPLDLVIAGPASYTSQRLTDPVSRFWAAFSVAAAVALVVWSIAVFIKGMQSLGQMRLGRAAATGVLAAACMTGVAIALIVGTAALAGALA